MFAKLTSLNGNNKLPGGLLITVLVAECYRANLHRDDLALYDTMLAIRNRLLLSVRVFNPVDPSFELTYKDKYLRQVERLGDKLGEVLCAFTTLNAQSELGAYKAWRGVFQHDYWSDLISGVELSQANSLFIGATGIVYTQKPTVSHVSSPEHRFYGD
jgi:hypothetical protein